MHAIFWRVNARADQHTFLGWCADKQRRWCAEYAVAAVAKFKLGRGVPHVLTVAQARELMACAASYEDGAMAKYFALALFAGLRSGPAGELLKLARPGRWQHRKHPAPTLPRPRQHRRSARLLAHPAVRCGQSLESGAHDRVMLPGETSLTSRPS